MSALDFTPVVCRCGTVVGDGVFSGIFRPLCPKCKKRVWACSDGASVVVVMVDERPKRLP